MKEKLDFKKLYKDLYLPKAKPMLITVPPICFMMTDGCGAPEGYVEYVMPPLEGLWEGAGQGINSDRQGWKWTSLLRQPDFVTEEVFRWAQTEVRAKKPEINAERVRLAVYDEGVCVQMLHVGPYAQEPETLAAMAEFIEKQGLRDDCGGQRRHHEIYLGDPRRTAPDKLKTVLRHPVTYR